MGGGITGAGAACDAASRGLSVLLADTHDFASGTSHLTSKLVHGGLRYLEHGHFRLVAESTAERNRLVHQLAPNLVRPLKFMIPYESNRLLKWLLTVLGLQLYDLMGFCFDGNRSRAIFAAELRRKYPSMVPHPLGVSFWDAQTNDARLVMSVLRSAQREGAGIYNYTRVTSARFNGRKWRVDLLCQPRELEWTVSAKSIINATGPWAPQTAGMLGISPPELMWLKGTHILLRRPASFGNDAVIIRSVRDNRSMWVIPWQQRLIVGTTESKYSGDLRDARPTTDEVSELLQSAAHWFPSLELTPSDILGAYAGVRPIVEQDTENENELSRRHEKTVDRKRHVVTMMGGKLTTFRLMAEEAIDSVVRMLGGEPTSASVKRRLRQQQLWPGLSTDQARVVVSELARRYVNLIPKTTVEHLVRHYGHDANVMLHKAEADPSLGAPLIEGLPHCLAEMSYVCEQEEVCHLLDLVKRRTPLYFQAGRTLVEVLPRIAVEVGKVLGWSKARRDREVESVVREFDADLAALSDLDESQFGRQSVSLDSQAKGVACRPSPISSNPLRHSNR